MNIKVKILIGTLLTVIVLMGGVIYFLATNIPETTVVYIEEAATPASEVLTTPAPSNASDALVTPPSSETATPMIPAQANAQIQEDTATPKPETQSASASNPTPKPTPKPTAKPTPKPTPKPTATNLPPVATPAPTNNPPVTPYVPPTPQPTTGDGGDTPFQTPPPEYSVPHL